MYTERKSSCLLVESVDIATVESRYRIVWLPNVSDISSKLNTGSEVKSKSSGIV